MVVDGDDGQLRQVLHQDRPGRRELLPESGIPNGHQRLLQPDLRRTDLLRNLPSGRGGISVVVPQGQTTTGIDFALVRGGSISGTVWAGAIGLPAAMGDVSVVEASGSVVWKRQPAAAGHTARVPC